MPGGKTMIMQDEGTAMADAAVPSAFAPKPKRTAQGQKSVAINVN